MINSERRRFITKSAGLVGKVAATGALSLPLMASMSQKAQAWGWPGWKDDPGAGNGGGNPACFLRGTLIRTTEGEIPVEELKIGTLVETLSGAMPIKWIGRQKFGKDSTSWHWSVAPIRIARFALSDEHPRRDLYVSPRHSLLIDGFLIPAAWLVNGKSVTMAALDERDEIDYFHIELETHEVIFAEGAPAETLLVTDDRERFVNFVEYERLYGTATVPAMKPFAPVLEYQGVHGELERLLRLAVSPIVDIRDPIQKARAKLSARAELVAQA